MRYAWLLVALFLAACAAEDRAANGTAERAPGLTGLYSGSNGGGKKPAANGDRLCLRGEAVNPEGARFAFVTLGEAIERGRAACSGLGKARRVDDTLAVTMTGDGDCSFSARIVDERILFPAEVPEGCSYYCSEAASLAGQEFALSEAGEEAARRAVDLVGDPLCP